MKALKERRIFKFFLVVQKKRPTLSCQEGGCIVDVISNKLTYGFCELYGLGRPITDAKHGQRIGKTCKTDSKSALIHCLLMLCVSRKLSHVQYVI